MGGMPTAEEGRRGLAPEGTWVDGLAHDEHQIEWLTLKQSSCCMSSSTGYQETFANTQISSHSVFIRF